MRRACLDDFFDEAGARELGASLGASDTGDPGFESLAAHVVSEVAVDGGLLRGSAVGNGDPVLLYGGPAWARERLVWMCVPLVMLSGCALGVVLGRRGIDPAGMILVEVMGVPLLMSLVLAPMAASPRFFASSKHRPESEARRGADDDFRSPSR